MRVLFVLIFMVFSISSYTASHAVVEMMMDKMWDIPDIPNEVKKELSQAILIHPSEIGSIVKEHKVDLNLHRIRGEFPLFFAAEVARSPKAVEELLKAGADANQRDYMDTFYYRTVLHKILAKINPQNWMSHIISPEKEIIKILVKYGADPNVKDGQENTPYMQLLINIYTQYYNDPVYNIFPKELMSLLRKGKTAPEIVQEFDVLIEQFESLLHAREDYFALKELKLYGNYKNHRTRYAILRLKLLMEQEFSTLMEEAKGEQERQMLKVALRSSQNRLNLLSRTINKIKVACRFAFSATH